MRTRSALASLTWVRRVDANISAALSQSCSPARMTLVRIARKQLARGLRAIVGGCLRAADVEVCLLLVEDVCVALVVGVCVVALPLALPDADPMADVEGVPENEPVPGVVNVRSRAQMWSPWCCWRPWQ